MDIPKRGFTLAELLIVIAILIILIAVVLINVRGQTDRAHDAKRKTDLYVLKIALEEYMNDNEGQDGDRLPPDTIIASCGSANLVPYISSVPCDPRGIPYAYLKSLVSGFRVCTTLADTSDPVITQIGCAGATGCGVGDGQNYYNYCVASGTTPSAIGTADDQSGTFVPTLPPGVTIPSTQAWACTPPDSNGVSSCNLYTNPSGSGCKKVFEDGTCNNECTNPLIRCTQ